MTAANPSKRPDIGIGYTLATGRLFCSMSDFHQYAEELVGRPIFTHEFGSEALWLELRDTFETTEKVALVP